MFHYKRHRVVIHYLTTASRSVYCFPHLSTLPHNDLHPPPVGTLCSSLFLNIGQRSRAHVKCGPKIPTKTRARQPKPTDKPSQHPHKAPTKPTQYPHKTRTQPPETHAKPTQTRPNTRTKPPQDPHKTYTTRPAANPQKLRNSPYKTTGTPHAAPPSRLRGNSSPPPPPSGKPHPIFVDITNVFVDERRSLNS